MRRSLACLILPAILGAACNATPEEPVINFTQYRAAFTAVVTDYFKRCGMLEAGREAQLAQMSLLAVPPELQAVIDEEVMIGRARLKTDCFAPLKDASCDVNEAFATIAGCLTGGKQFSPQVGAGKLCRLQGECIDGFCDLGAVKKPCGTGVCSPYLKTGTQCGAGKGQCNPDKDSCWSEVCRARGGAGAECATDGDCDAASFCRGDSGGKRSCASRQSNIGTGASCDPAQLPDGCKAGDRCTESAPGKGDYACRTGRDEGGACFTTLDCKGGLFCGGADVAMGKQGQCKKQGRQGDGCASGGVCQLTLYCSKEGTCRAAGTAGSSCDGVAGSASCLAGFCTATMTQSGVCQDLKVDGSSCAASSECRSGACDRSGTCGTVCAPLR